MSSSASIFIAPSSAFHFGNANVGDIIIRGFDPSQRILMGTGAAGSTPYLNVGQDGLVMPLALTLSNALGQAVLTSSGSYLGINNPSPMAELDVQGHAQVSSSLMVGGATTLSNTLTLAGSAVMTSDVAVHGPLTLHDDVVVSSNLVVNGDMTVNRATFNYSNVVVFSSQTIQSNMEVDQDLVVGSDASVGSNLSVLGAAHLLSNLDVQGTASLASNVVVGGELAVSGTMVVYGSTSLSNLQVAGEASLSSGLAVASNLAVGGATTLSGDLTVQGDLTSTHLSVSGGTTTLSGDLAVASNLAVGGATTLSGDLTVQGDLTSTHLSVSGGTTTLSGDLAVASNLAVGGATTLSGDLTVQGDLTSTHLSVSGGTTTLSGDLAVASNLAVGGATTLSGDLTVQGDLTSTHLSVSGGTTTLSGDLAVASNLVVGGATTLSGDLTVQGDLTSTHLSVSGGTTTLSGDLAVASNLAVGGATTLSGALTSSNVALFASNVTVLGVLDVAEINYSYSNVVVYSSLEVSSNLEVEGGLVVHSNAVFQSAVELNNGSGTSVLSSDGSNLGINTVGSPVYTLDVGCDLNVVGGLFSRGVPFTGWNFNAYGDYVSSNAAVGGEATATDALVVYSKDASDVSLALSNASGKTQLYTSNTFVGINTDGAPQYMLDVNGDINFTGGIFHNGAVFSGWNSNMFGNFINSNAAFQGEATAEDVLLLYTSPGGGAYSNLALSFSNATGKASVHSSNGSLGLQAVAPTSVLDVGGDVRATQGLFALSDGSAAAKPAFQAMRAAGTGTVMAGVGGDAIVTGSTWVESIYARTVGMMSRLALTGDSNAVASNASAYDGSGAIAAGAAYSDASLPVRRLDPLLYLPSGDASLSNLYSSGSAMLQGSAWVDGALSANQTHVRTLLVTNAANTFSNATLGATDAAVDYKLPLASPDFVLTCTSGDASLNNVLVGGALFVNDGLALNGGLTGNAASLRALTITGGASNFYTDSTSNSSVALPVDNLASATANPLVVALLSVTGDLASEGSLALRSNAYVGGTVFLGSNVNAQVPAQPNSVAPSLSNVVLDCRGDMVVESGAYVGTSLFVGSNVGVGTQQPACPVDIQANTGGVSLTCSAKVTATEFSVYSDRRIKTDIVASDTDAQLATLMDLSVSEFAYIDPSDKATGRRVGLIAQQVAQVIPACVMKTADYVPNVLAQMDVLEDNDAFGGVRLCTAQLPPDVRQLLVRGTPVKCRHDNINLYGSVTCADVDGAWVMLALNRGLPAGATKLLVVGTRVSDYHSINYEQINAIAIGAIQAQERRLAALEARFDGGVMN